MKTINHIIIFSLIIFLSACGGDEFDESLVLQEGQIEGVLHESSIGKITFMDRYIPYDEYSEKDFLTQFSINTSEKSDLFIRTFLDKTLAWRLHELAPNLTLEELCNQGNFQFSFYVNGKFIYKENLTVGAGGCSFKSSMLVFTVPLFSEEEIDSWGRFLWMRFMKKGGGEAALSEGQHQLKIEIRPYVNAPDLKVGDIIAEGAINLNIIKKAVTESDIAIQDIAPESGFHLSEDPFSKDKIRDLNKKIAQNDFQDITSIVVLKNGQLLLEEYFNGSNRATLHDTRSVGKTFAGTMLGIAIDEGHIKNEQQTLDQFYTLSDYDNHSKNKEKVTLKSLLTMSPGFDANDFDMNSPGNEEYMYPTDDWVKFALDLPMDKQKTIGQNWNYFTAGIVILGDILNQKLPEGLEKYTHEKLFEPLGIQSYQWQYTPTKVPNTAGGLQLSSLGYAKYGQLYQNGGRWNGQQLIAKDWVDASLAQQIALPEGENEFYGYLFWNKTYEINGHPYEVSYCSGNGGNKIFVFKDFPVVVVITATAYGQGFAHVQVDQIMNNYILPAIVE